MRSYPALLVLTAALAAACTSGPTTVATPSTSPQVSSAATSAATPAQPSPPASTAPAPTSAPTSATAGTTPVTPSDDDASAVVSSLGAVPIPTAPAADPTPTASVGHPQLLAIGAPVNVTLPGGVTAVVTALGPDQLITDPPASGKPPQSTIGIISITAVVSRGSVTFHDADFSSRDETGEPISLTAHGPATVTATAGHPATMRIQGRFSSGAAQVTWTSGKAVLALWDFNIELD